MSKNGSEERSDEISNAVAELADLLEFAEDDFSAKDAKSLDILKELRSHINQVVENSEAGSTTTSTTKDSASHVDHSKSFKDITPNNRKPIVGEEKGLTSTDLDKNIRDIRRSTIRSEISTASTYIPRSESRSSSIRRNSFFGMYNAENPMPLALIAPPSLTESDFGNSKRPTPYELWKNTHVVVESSPKKPAAKLTNQCWDKLVTRLDTSSDKYQRLLSKQTTNLARELKELTFSPELDPKSRDLASKQGLIELPQRVDKMRVQTQMKLSRLAQDKRLKELAYATGVPDLNTPCICGGGNGLSSTKGASLEELEEVHTEFCLRFMNVCDLKNRRSLRKLDEPRRTDHLFDFEERKKKKIEMKRRMIEQQENKNLTFTPKINSYSNKILKKMLKEGRALRSKTRVTNTANDPGHGEDKFQPDILSRSNKMQFATPVHNRLYTEALHRQSKFSELHKNRYAETINENIIEESHLNTRHFLHRRSSLLTPAMVGAPEAPEGVVKATAANLSKRAVDLSSYDNNNLHDDLEEGERGLMKRQPKSLPRGLWFEAQSMNYINVVTYDANHSFIVQQLAKV